MKFNQFRNKIKLSSALIATTTIVGGAILTIPLLLSANNTNTEITSSNLDYKNIINQDNNQTTNTVSMQTQPAQIQSFFYNQNTKIYANNISDSLFAVVTREDGYDVLYSWGENTGGKLGNFNTTPYVKLPTLVTFGNLSKYKITHVVSSIQATTVVLNGNEIWAAGSNRYYERGADTTGASAVIFLKRDVLNGANIKSLYAGAGHRVAVTTDDKVWVWGLNGNGQLGMGTNGTDQATPFDLTQKLADKIPNWAAGEFYVGTYNTAILVDGQIYIWGWNEYGQTGNEKTDSKVSSPPTEPARLPSGRKIWKYVMGGVHSLAILDNKTLFSWGYNSLEQLGLYDRTVLLVRIPTHVEKIHDGITNIQNVTDVFASKYSSFFVMDKKFYSCGSNKLGILAVDPALVTNQRGFKEKPVNSSIGFNDFLPTSSTFMATFSYPDKDIWMCGSNEFGQFSDNSPTGSANYDIRRVHPFRDQLKLKSKANNKQYTATTVAADLQTNTSAEIKLKLPKYVDGFTSYLTNAAISYSVLPKASADGSKVTLQLLTNCEYNLDGARNLVITFNIDVEITNFRFDNTTEIAIKRIPEKGHTANIQAMLKLGQTDVPTDMWWSGIADIDRFPEGTTFTKIIDDKVIEGTDTTNWSYEGKLVPTKYYKDNNIVQNSNDTAFPFKFTGLRKIGDSNFTLSPIYNTLNIENIDSALPVGPIDSSYLPMFVKPSTFPEGTTFKIKESTYNVIKRTYSGVLSYDKHHKNGLLIEGEKLIEFHFDNFKTIKQSELIPTGFSDENIHSFNIEKLLIDTATMTVNKEALAKFADIKSYPEDAKFTVKVLPTMVKLPDSNVGTYTGEVFVDKSYQDWIEKSGEVAVPFAFENIAIATKSGIVYRQMPSGYDIENIEASLKGASGIIDNNVLNQFIKTFLFPLDTTFTMGEVKTKDPVTGEFTFEIIPSQYYESDGTITNNTGSTLASYSVTFQFAPIPVQPSDSTNLALIIGSSVGGAVLLGIIILIYIKRFDMQIAWWNKKTQKYLE